jgi:ubiquitin-conjugating enzyme E2 J1
MRKSTAQSLGRIMREYEEIKSSINGNWIARPLNLEDPYEWHFVLRGPPNSVYEVCYLKKYL